MKRKCLVLVVSALLLLILIPVFLFLIRPLLEKVPEDYFSRVEFIGQDRILQPGEKDLGPVFPMKEVINWQVLTRKGDVLILQMNWKAEDLNSSQVIWETRGSVGIDVNTRQLLPGYGDLDREGYFGFPVNLEKKNYEIWHPGLYGKSNAVFQKEEAVKGLRTYLFTFDIKDMPNSESYPQFKPRQAVMDIKDKFWVEPVSGRIVDYDEWFESRLLKTYLPEQVIETGTFRFTDATVLQQIQLAEKERMLRQQFSLWIPLSLGIIALALFFAAALSGKRHGQTEVER